MHDVTVGGHFWHFISIAACMRRGRQYRTVCPFLHGNGMKRLVVPCTVVPRILIFIFFLSSEASNSIVVKHEWKKNMSCFFRFSSLQILQKVSIRNLSSDLQNLMFEP